MRRSATEAYLFHEQWVVKGAEQGMKFAWHQDSGYVKWYNPTTEHKPYVTCWCTLDDVSEENGTVYLLPHSRGGTKSRSSTTSRKTAPTISSATRATIRAMPLIVPAGSIVAFDSFVFHRSGAEQDRPHAPHLSAAVQRRAD